MEQELLSRQVREYESENLSSTTDQSSQLSLNDIAQAVAFKDKLIEFDRTRFESENFGKLKFDVFWKFLVHKERKLLMMLQIILIVIINGLVNNNE